MVAALFVLGPQSTGAMVNETLSCALEAAMPYVDKGFTVREDNWQGKIALGAQKAIKHQLFKGNEYWFWLGSATPGITLSVKIYDSNGRPVDVETKVEQTFASARVLAPKTGTYFIVIKAVLAKQEADGEENGKEKEEKDPKKKKDPKKEEAKAPEVEWALVYGFR